MKHNLSFSSCIIAADTHLQQNSESSILPRLLAKAGELSCPVIFCGDIVNLWFRSRRLAETYRTDFSKIRKYIESHPPCYFIPGNRDFLVGSRFHKATGLIILDEITDITVSGTSYRLLHGDQIFLGDRNYRVYRRLVRNRIVRGVLNSLPDILLKGLASILEREPKIPQEQKDIPLDTGRFRKYVYSPSVSTYICGHIHRTMRVNETIEKHTVTVQTVGSWIEGGSEYLLIDSEGIHIQTL